MSSSVDPRASKKDGAASDRAKGGDAPALLTEEALLRLEAGLRAASVRQGSAFPPPPGKLLRSRHPHDSPLLRSVRRMRGFLGKAFHPLLPPREKLLGLLGRTGGAFPSRTRPPRGPEARRNGKAEKRTANWPIVSSLIDTARENRPLARNPNQPKIRTEEHWWRDIGNVQRTIIQLSCSCVHGWVQILNLSWPSWRGVTQLGLLLCALLLIVCAGALEFSLKARTGGSTEAAPIEAGGRMDEPRMNAVISSAVAPSLLPDDYEPHQPMTNAVKSSVATRSPPPLPRPRPMNNRRSSNARHVSRLRTP